MTKIIYILLIIYSTLITVETLDLFKLNSFEWQIKYSVDDHNCTFVYTTKEGQLINPFVIVLYSDENNIEVKKICHNKTEFIFLNIQHSQLVDSIGCFISTGENGYCVWSVVKDVKDVVFSYAFDLNFTIAHCSNYLTDFECNVKASISQDINILVTGTLNGKSVSTLLKTSFKARPPPINLIVTNNATAFDLKWIPPNLKNLKDWIFIISYTECNNRKTETVPSKTSIAINRISCCRYCFMIMAETMGDDRTAWSKENCFNPEIETLTVIGFLIAALALVISGILSYFLLRKNKRPENNRNSCESVF
ncbi:hypothetical protein KM759_gp131 [Lymphocystis disease virus 4]|uniref:Uncharacterized protein n=1 Tax=Lymphocystis disease virus 4 TaxID=2704413 RepID=A0A6B9XJW3_9VIRU|nr:hypothetical protein KM759_gp131 [Lymphocystis disease virus 4]QHR78485.1 hypothetical protein [Lymphocystis disease virus 4]